MLISALLLVIASTLLMLMLVRSPKSEGKWVVCFACNRPQEFNVRMCCEDHVLQTVPFGKGNPLWECQPAKH